MNKTVITKVLKALADHTRLEIVTHLAFPKTCNNGACKSVRNEFELTQPTLSHHFKILLEAGIVDELKKGTEKHYHLRKKELKTYGIDILKMVKE